MSELDPERVARELLVAIRGHRSQTAFSRWLGYRSNVVYSWEAGRRWPTGAEFLRAARRAGVDLTDAFTHFHGKRPRWLDDLDPATPEGVAAFLVDLRAGESITDLSRRCGLSRYSISRWLSGRTQPRLPDLLRVVEAATLRLVDFVEALVDPAAVPSVSEVWHRLEARRRGAFELPWTQAILRGLELEEYTGLPAHEPGWLATRIGISAEEEARCIAFLRETGQIVWSGTHFRQETLAVDTRRHPEVGQRLKAHWTRVAADRIDRAAPGQFSYNIFAVSRADFERIRAAHLDYYATLRAIVAESEPQEVVAVANVQLFDLGR